MDKYVNIFIENMKNKIIEETNVAKETAVLYSKYYTSIAIDQFKIYFKLSPILELDVNKIILCQTTLSENIEIQTVPPSVHVYIENVLKYVIPNYSLKQLINTVKWKNKINSIVTLYARYSIRNNTYMICFYDLNTFSRRPDSKIYEEIILAEIIDTNNVFMYNVTYLFKMYAGHNYDYNCDITDITVLDILLTPSIFYDQEYESKDIVNCRVRLEYNNCEKILKLDDFVKNYLVLNSLSM